jgi:hypothetical protein
MWLARALLLLLVVPKLGFAASSLARSSKTSDSAAAVLSDGTIETIAFSAQAAGVFEGMKSKDLIKLAFAIGNPDLITSLRAVISKHIRTIKKSELFAKARSLGVEQNELDLAANAEDPRAAIIELISMGMLESEDPSAEESAGTDDDDDDDDNDGSDASLIEGRRRRRRRKNTRRRRRNAGKSARKLL